MTLCARRQLIEGISGEATYNFNVTSISKGELQLNLHQQIDAKNATSLGIVATPFYKEVSLKVDYERLLTKTEKIVIST